MLLRRLAFQLNRADKLGDADSIHDLRVAIRRFSRCLQAFGQFFPEASRKKLRRQLAGLMEVAGGVRDVDVALGLLAQAGVSGGAGVVKLLESQRVDAGQALAAEIRLWRGRNFSRKWRRWLEL